MRSPSPPPPPKTRSMCSFSAASRDCPCCEVSGAHCMIALRHSLESCALRPESTYLFERRGGGQEEVEEVKEEVGVEMAVDGVDGGVSSALVLLALR